MKRIITIAVAAAAIALVPAPEAAADNLSFIQDLNNNGLYVYDTATALNTGWAICNTLDNYNGVYVVEAFYRVTGWDVPDRATAWVWVESAAEQLCPWNDHRTDNRGIVA
jgi:hypothetical protein